MMTPEQQVKAALKILAPPPRLRNAVQEEIEYALSEIDAMCSSAKPPSTKVKTKLRSLLASLKKSQNIARELAEQDLRWRRFPLDLIEHMERCSRQLRMPAGPKRRSADREKFAVAHAQALLFDALFNKYADMKDLAVTRENKWYRLSAVLFGNEGHNLYRHMRNLKQVNQAAFVRPDPGRK